MPTAAAHGLTAVPSKQVAHLFDADAVTTTLGSGARRC